MGSGCRLGVCSRKHTRERENDEESHIGSDRARSGERHVWDIGHMSTRTTALKSAGAWRPRARDCCKRRETGELGWVPRARERRANTNAK